MRQARILGSAANSSNFYHCISRAIERRFIFEHRVEKDRFRALILSHAKFAGVRVLTYCVMGNHFHLLVEVPRHDAESLAAMTDDDLLRRLSHICSKERIEEVRRELDWRKEASHESYRAYRRTFERRMCHLSSFLQEVKQSYSRWYNRRAERSGPLWEDRFKSVLVEGRSIATGDVKDRRRIDVGALATIAAYIDLNPVRAGIVAEPNDYRWCGYTEAVGGCPEFRAGIARVAGFGERESPANGAHWDAIASRYRQILGERGAKPRRPHHESGSTSTNAFFHRRIRHFTDGIVLGTKEFVDRVFAENRAALRTSSKRGARKPRGIDLGPLHTMRHLRGETTS